MKRERQIELIETAEERTIGYFKAWIKNASFKAALHRRNSDRSPSPHEGETVRKRACA